MRKMEPLEVKSYEILRENFGQENAETIVQFIGKKSQGMFDAEKDKLVTKGDFNDLRGEFKQLKGEVNLLKGDVNHLKTDVSELKVDFKELRKDLRAMEARIGEQMQSTLKWCFGLWTGVTAAIVAGMKIFGF